MVVSISQTGKERQEQTSGDLSTSWKLGSCLTVPGQAAPCRSYT